MVMHYIGADVDTQAVNLAVERNGKIIRELVVPTNIPSLVAALESVGRPRKLAFEEGTLAHWLARNLRPHVDELIVSDPRRNRLICDDGDKDDRIDGRKLAALLRGGFLRAVYHSDDDQRVLLKQWVGLYHDRIKDAVRQANKVRALCWRHGVRPVRGVLRDPVRREDWLTELDDHPLVAQARMLFVGFDANYQQVAMARGEMARAARAYEIIGYWRELPGVGPIRATTLLAYLDTPWRFASPARLCKYCGVGLQRTSSGKDRHGQMNVGRLQLGWQVNRRLKNATMGAALSAVRQGTNVFAERYERMVRNGQTVGNALHTVARKMLTVMWGMWKSSTRFDPSLV